MLTLLFNISLATAGSVKKGVYLSGHGYTITPPKGWRVIDRGNKTLFRDQMPPSLAKATEETYDVLIYDKALTVEDNPPSTIHDNIMVVVVAPNPTPEITAENQQAVARDVKAELEKMYAKVEAVSAETKKHAGVDSIELVWKIEDKDATRRGTIVQVVLPAFDRTLLVTCSIGHERVEERQKTCAKVIDSIVLPK